MAPKQWTADEVEAGNHDWDFTEDEQGNIIALNVTGSVKYTNEAETMVRGERLDIWGQMTQAQKDKVQAAYTQAKQVFDNYYLGS